MELKKILEEIKEMCKVCKVCDPCCTGNLIKKCVENNRFDATVPI